MATTQPRAYSGSTPAGTERCPRGRASAKPPVRPYDPPAPSLTPLVGRPRWKRSVRTIDVGPGDDDDASSSRGGTSATSVVLPAADPKRRPFNPLVVKRRGTDDWPESEAEAGPAGTRRVLIEEIDESDDGAGGAPRPDVGPECVDGAAPSTPKGDANILCPTCERHRARYRCPRCDAPYCSAACYRVHDVPPSAAAASDGSAGGDFTGGGGRCTESFYRDRVAAEMKLGVTRNLENEEKMRGILARAGAEARGEEERGSGGAKDDSNSEINDVAVEEAVNEEDLADIAAHLLSLEDCESGNGEVDRIEDLIGALSPSVRDAFEAAVAKGELSHLVRDSQKPWWEAEVLLSPSPNQLTVGIAEENKEAEDHPPFIGVDKGGKTLDERILAIPPLRTLRPSLSQSQSLTSSSPSGGPVLNVAQDPPAERVIDLTHNILDVLYATALALRLSLENSIPSLESSLDETISTCDALLSSSAVLSSDARHDSVEGALTECACRSEEMRRRHLGAGMAGEEGETGEGRIAPWARLCRDVSSLSKHRRLVLRALLEAEDALKRGERAMKKLAKRTGADTTKEGNGNGAAAAVRQFKLARKKVGYYQSWCAAYWNSAALASQEDLPHAILGWVEDWSRESELKLVREETFLSEAVNGKNNRGERGHKIEVKIR